MMWSTQKDERGSGGPVLRDPMAALGRTLTQPYQQNNFGNRLPRHNQPNGAFRGNLVPNPLFPPTLDSAPFPPGPRFLGAPPPRPNLPLMNVPIPRHSPPVQSQFQYQNQSSEPPVSRFHGFPGPQQFERNSPQSFLLDDSNKSFSFQTHQQNAPIQQSLLGAPPQFNSGPHNPNLQLLGTQNTFQNHPQPDPTVNLPLRNSYQTPPPEPMLNLQPQWSTRNNESQYQAPTPPLSNNQSGFQNQGPMYQQQQQQNNYERRPFNQNQKQQQSSNIILTGNNKTNIRPVVSKRPELNFERRPLNQPRTQQPTQRFPAPQAFQQRQGPVPLFDIDVSSSSGTGSVQSFPTSISQNSQQGNTGSRSYNGSQQQSIPSLMNMNTRPVQNNQGGGNGPRFNKRPAPSSNNSSQNGNNITLTRNKQQRPGPLLPTPKLVPYPPPPLQPKSTEPLIIRPRGILKNSNSSGYSNFVKEGDLPASNENSPTSVVPYDIGDDEDDDESEFVVEAGRNEKSSMTHDFFSEKIIQHFTSVFNGKSTEEQLDMFLKYLVLPADFLSTRVVIVRNLHVMLTETFKNCNLQPYGADFIGIGNSDDSVNVFVDLTGKQGPSNQVESRIIEPLEVSKESLEELLNLIQEDKNHKFFGQIVRRTNFSLSRMNLPVISFIHLETKVRCNLRMDNYFLVQEAKVIQFLCSLDIRISSLLAVARYWSSVHKVLDTPEEDTKNRFITLLMLFFLARKEIIPTMQHLQSLSVKREYFNNTDISFCDDHSLVPPNENSILEDKAIFTLSTLSLLKEFFKTFATAKLKDEVVSLWKAEFIPKDNFSVQLESKILPADIRKRYRYGVNGKLRDKRLDTGSKLCVQDFQDLTDNLTLSVADYDVNRFQIECDDAFKKLEAILSSGSGNIMDLFVISEYATYGTSEHRAIHKLVYLLDSIAEEQLKRASDSKKEPGVCITIE